MSLSCSWAKTLSEAGAQLLRKLPASVASSLSHSTPLIVVDLLAVQQRPKGALGHIGKTLPTLVPQPEVWFASGTGPHLQKQRC